MKRALEISLALLLIGAILLGVGLAFGGRILSDGTRYWYGNNSFHWFGWNRYDYNTQTQYIGAPDGETEDITILDLSFGEGRYVISPATEQNPAYSLEVDDRFKVESSLSNGKYTLSIKNNKNFGRTNYLTNTIYLPIDEAFEYISVGVGAGTLDIPYLQSDILCLEAGMGTLSAGSLMCDKLDAEVGMGTMSLSSVDAQTLTLDVGMGTASVSLTGDEREYGYEVSGGLGTISFNGQNLVGGIGSASRRGGRMIYADVGMGTIRFSTDS